jgi:hypothetical protein
MKKTIPIYFLLALGLTSNAQTIESTDLPVPGRPYLLGYTNATADPGAKGAAVSWNFSSLTKQTNDTGGVLLPSVTPYASSFPNTTHATLNTDDENGTTYSYYQLTNTKAEVFGLVFLPKALPTIILKTIEALSYYKLPMAYGTKTTSSGKYVGKAAYSYVSLPFINIDSLEATIITSKNDTVDAYGDIVTPVASYDAIRLKSVASRTISLKARNHGIWADVPSSLYETQTETETTYNWWAKGIGVEVFKITYLNGSPTPTSVKWYESSPTLGTGECMCMSSVLISPNPTSSVVSFNPSNNSAYQLSIRNLQGVEVLSKQGLVGVQTISTTSLNEGTYVALLNFENGTSQKTKLVIQR